MSRTGASLPPDTNRAVPGLPIYMWIGCGIATLIVPTRLYIRLVLVKAAGWDDLLIAISYAFAIVLFSSTQIQIDNGYGRHIEYIPTPNLITILKLDTMSTLSGFTSLALARTSIGIFLLRLVGRFKKLRIPVYTGLAINTVQAVALIIWNGVHCVPLSKEWSPNTPGFCIDGRTFVIVDRFLGCLNVLVDLIFAIFPVFLLQKLQVKLKVRLAVYLLLSCGLLAAVASVGRVVSSDLTTPDVTYNLIPLTWWALSEVTGVLILACIPSFHALLLHTKRTAKLQRRSTRFFPSAFTSNRGAKGSEDRALKRPNKSVSASTDRACLDKHPVQVRKSTFIELADANLEHGQLGNHRGQHEENSGVNLDYGPGKVITVIE